MYYLLAHLIGFVAMTIYICSYQIRSSRLMIVYRMLGDITYIIHYLMLGAYSGCVTLVVCALNGFVYSNKGQPWAEWKGWKWFFSIVLILACLITWRSDFDPIPCVCTLISILTVIFTTWSGRSTVIRLGKLFSAGPAWLIYCLAVGSYSGILGEVIGMASAAIGIYRYGLKEHQDLP